MTDPMEAIYEHFMRGFRQALAGRDGGRRIGAELKFPLVNADGSAASYETVRRLWEYLQGLGWRAETDALTGKVAAARTPGERNDTVASCETGYCKVEFSLAHVADLFALNEAVRELLASLEPFWAEQDVRLLGCGIHPVTPPGKRLMMRKTRTVVWDKVFGANRCLSPEDGDDVCLFTVNTASHVHLSTTPDECVKAVNVLNGFAGAQIALTANSGVWKGGVDPDYRCVAEKLWDWWMPDGDRVGVPARPFRDVRDYLERIARLRPVYVQREGRPVVLTDYDSFADYYARSRAVGTDDQGREASLVPAPGDIDLHSTCYWHNARLSRYFTVENRTNDQQPPDELICIAALTLGLVSALDEAGEVIDAHDWDALRAARETACRRGLAEGNGGVDLPQLAAEMLDVAGRGLARRGLGEERFLEPLRQRLAARRCPADEAAELFRRGGIDALVKARTI